MRRWQACGPVLCIVLGCAQGTERGPEPEGPRGIVFLLLDTVRADHLSAYGYARDTTPTLERLVDGGTRFDNLQAASPWTVPSMASIWTGVHPTRHGAGVETDGVRKFHGPGSYMGFDASATTLPGRLRELGYRTYACIANPLVGIECFASDFDELLVERTSATELVSWVGQRLDSLSEKPFFLYLHFMDTHVPLEPPPTDLTRYMPADTSARTLQKYSNLRRWSRFKKVENDEAPAFREFARLKEAAYDGTIRYLDGEIARLVEMLAQAGLDDVLFIVTSDHGEELWDHWETTRATYAVDTKNTIGCSHGHTLFQELLRVPLILNGPGIPAGLVVEERVRHIDIGRTILEVAAPSSRSGLGDGESVLPYLRGESDGDRLSYSEGLNDGYELRAIVDASGLKLIRSTHPDEKDLLFDLKSDPAETHDLIEERQADAARLRAEIDAVYADLHGRRFAPGERAMGVSLDQLEALGYAGDAER